jgi:hypothetical protein
MKGAGAITSAYVSHYGRSRCSCPEVLCLFFFDGQCAHSPLARPAARALIGSPTAVALKVGDMVLTKARWERCLDAIVRPDADLYTVTPANRLPEPRGCPYPRDHRAAQRVLTRGMIGGVSCVDVAREWLFRAGMSPPPLWTPRQLRKYLDDRAFDDTLRRRGEAEMARLHLR